MRLFLGPQRLVTTLGAELAELPYHGQIAAITAGWQEREAEDEELQAVVGHRAVNLALHARADKVFAGDRELFLAHRRKQDVLRRIQDLYRLRLSALMSSARSLMGLDEDPELLQPELEQVIASIQHLDQHHIGRAEEVEAVFADSVRLDERDLLAAERAEVQRIVARCELVAIAGGHVATLINRLRLFALEESLRERPIVAWSAGAMALTERVVLFHDEPAQGRGNAEVLGPGLGLVSGVVALPHARRRLRLDDPGRVSIFARRFSPAVCVALDEGSRLEVHANGRLVGGPHTRILTARGEAEALSVTMVHCGVSPQPASPAPWLRNEAPR